MGDCASFVEILHSRYSSTLFSFYAQDEDKGVTAGEWLGKYYFHCAPKRGLFVKLQSCQPDVRFQCSRQSEPSLVDYGKFSGESVPSHQVGLGMSFITQFTYVQDRGRRFISSLCSPFMLISKSLLETGSGVFKQGESSQY